MAALAASFDHEVSETEASLLSAAKAFLATPGRRRAMRQARRWPGEPPRDEFARADWTAMAQMGWLGALASEAAGGLGLDACEGLRIAALIAEQCGAHVAPEPFTAVAGLSASILDEARTARSLELLGRLLSGESIIALAVDQEGSFSSRERGQPEASDEVLATPSLAGEQAWSLSGVRRHVSPARPVDGWIVPASLDGDLALVWVEAAAAGADCTAQIAADGRSLASLRFDRVEASERDILLRGPQARAAMARALAVGRVLTAAELLGAGRAALEATTDYLKTRKQFDRFIGSFQAVQHRCVDAFIHLEIAEASLREALREAPRHGLSSLEAHYFACRAKARCGEAALGAARAAVQLHGAIGTTDECDVGLFFKRVATLLPRLGGISASRRACGDFLARQRDDEVEASRAQAAGGGEWESASEPQFRATVRAFLAENYPPQLRYMPRRVHWPEIADWWRVLYAKGWIAPAWPREYGGMGLPPDKLIALIEEFENFGVARAPDQGVVMVGPVLMRFGTREQRERFLPKILSGEHIWCQGYSEPGAGSDLASLRTEALDAGDHFLVNGQKIWTTLAQDATHIFLLARTDKTVRKQAGISFLLCDLKSPGVVVRPIRDMAGREEFCEVFFDDVRIPRDNLVGAVNDGWTIAKALLGFERIFLGSPKQSQYALGQLRRLALANGSFADAEFAARFTALQLDVLDLGASYRRYVDLVKQGDPLPASVSLLKVWATETYQRIALLIAESAGADGALLEPVLVDGAAMNVLAPLFNASAASIYGGANEIQRNILAKAVLGLPD
jgi:hypothetical protein